MKVTSINLPDGVRYCNIESAEHIHEIWEKIKDYEKVFTDENEWSELKFAKRLWHPGTLTLEIDGGILILDNVRADLFGQIHVIFWDHKLSARKELLKELLMWTFLNFNLQRLEAVIPEFCRALRRFLENRLNFTYEGRLRNRMSYKGNLCDVLVLSILREELQ